MQDSYAIHSPRLAVIFRLFFLSVSILLNLSCSGTQEKDHSMLPFGTVDTPHTGVTVKAAFVAGGWALSEDGIAGILIYIDRTFVTSTPLAVSRPDVLKAFPQFKNKISGWDVGVDVSKVPAGSHEIVIQARSNKGAVRDIGSLQINVAP